MERTSSGVDLQRAPQVVEQTITDNQPDRLTVWEEGEGWEGWEGWEEEGDAHASLCVVSVCG